MKGRGGKFLPAVLICIVGAASVLIGTVCFDYISRRIYEDSAVHLEEIYGQVDRSFGAFVERNWGLLDSCDDFFALAEEADTAAIADFLQEKQEYWGFSQFYFLGSDMRGLTPGGEEVTMDMGAAQQLLDGGDPVMAAQTLPDGQEVTVFAAPARPGGYEGFSFTPSPSATPTRTWPRP